MCHRDICGISRNFSRLSPCEGQVAYALLTRAPVAAGSIATPAMPLDLHVLSLSLAFILSQDQTLRCWLSLFSFFLCLHRPRYGSDPGGWLFLTEGFRPLPSSCLVIAVCQCALFSSHSPFRESGYKITTGFRSDQIFSELFFKKISGPRRSPFGKPSGSPPASPIRSRRNAPVPVLRVQR